MWVALMKSRIEISMLEKLLRPQVVLLMCLAAVVSAMDKRRCYWTDPGDLYVPGYITLRTGNEV